MIGALWTGISGLSSQQKALDNESNNIANVNTIGFKASRISFADQMYQDRIGKGSKILDAEKLYTQGSLKLTGVNYDMALSGDGFFTVLNTRSSGSAETLYTRAGNFRMGDNGTLQDSAGNEVQGWPMIAIDNQNDVTSTNPNVKVFNTDYSKLLGSKIIKHDTYVETVTAKATDYNSTAKSDSTTVFSGAGLKTKAAKIADIEAAITDYTTWLQKLKDEPDGLSATSIAQISQINFKTGSSGIISKDGDQIYAYINGNKYSQNYVVKTATAAQIAELYAYDQALPAASRFGFADPSAVGGLSASQTAFYDQAISRIETYKAFADKISSLSGLVATMTSESGGANNDVLEANDTFNLSTKLGDMYKGIIQIKSLIPGKEFTITEVGEISSSTTSQGYYLTTTGASAGSGIGALESSKNALSKLITGKQQDVYTTSEMGGFPANFTYGINIYDKELNKSIPVPNTGGTIPQDSPIVISGATSIDDFISKFTTEAALKTPKLTDYVEAVNINGNLVIRTLDKNYDVEFSGILKAAGSLNDDLTITGSGTSSASVAVGTVTDNTTYKMTINGTTVSYNSGTGATATSIALGLKAAIGSATITPAVTASGTASPLTIASTPAATVTGTANLTISGTRPASVTVPTPADNTLYTVNINGTNVSYTSGTGATTTSIITGLKAAIAATSPAISGITVGAATTTLDITYNTPLTVLEVNTPSQSAFVPKDKKTDFSGRMGAGAEFIEIKNKVDQTASKGSLQLKLDTLGLSDTAFGEFSVDSTGLVTMKQDGAEFAIGQVAIALFNNNQGLDPVGDNLLAKTNDSGEPIYNLNNEKTAKIEGKTLELSKADLSESLVNLMVFQRAFEANAKSITTSDELLNTLINLKR